MNVKIDNIINFLGKIKIWLSFYSMMYYFIRGLILVFTAQGVLFVPWAVSK